MLQTLVWFVVSCTTRTEYSDSWAAAAHVGPVVLLGKYMALQWVQKVDAEVAAVREKGQAPERAGCLRSCSHWSSHRWPQFVLGEHDAWEVSNSYCASCPNHRPELPRAPLPVLEQSPLHSPPSCVVSSCPRLTLLFSSFQVFV